MKWFRFYLVSLFILASAITAQAQSLGSTTTNAGSWSLDLAPDINDDWTNVYATPFITIGNQSIFSTERALTAGTCITGTDAGANSTYTVAITSACIDASLLATDSVSADELNAAGVEAELEAVIDLADLQGSLTLAGDVDGAHGSNDLDEVAVETELEGVLDVADLQGFSAVLTEAEAAAAYQPLDADLTSWAGITRASGFDTFVTTPSSANIKSLVTDETGTGGALVFATAPDITISATTETNIEAALDTLANVTSIGGDVTAGGDFISTDDIISGDDVLLSNAGVINFGAGDCTLTEGTDTLTIAGTCVLVTEAAGLQVGASVPFSDSAGTLTLQNVDALDGTTESTIEAAIDTLDNVSSIGATTESTIEAAIDTLDNVSSIGATTESTIEAAIDTLANLASVQSFAFDLDDNNFDELWGWDDGAATFDNFSLADINTEAAPANGDFVLIYGAEGDLRKVDWAELPGAGTGVDNFLDLTDTPNDYTTFAGDCVKVNGTEDGLEFDTCAAGSGDDLGNHTATENLKMATFDIDFGTGDVQIDYSANDLAFTGVTGDYSFDDTVGVTGSVVASVDVTATAGDVTSGDDIISGDDVLLSNAGVINFGAGDCTLTEGTDTLTIAGTCVLVTEAAGLQVGASVPFSDSAGTLTLQNVDALDGTTESTVEAAIDTLDNVSSIGATTESTIEAALDTLANVTSIGGDVTAGGDFISTDDIISGDDVLLSNAGVINFGAGDCTLTEGTDTLTIAGTCTLVSEIIVPDGDNTRDLGSAAATWATAHINSIELANGTANTLTATGGVLSIEGVALLSDSTDSVDATNLAPDSVGASELNIGDAESEIEGAIDTLANLTSVQGLTVTLADAGQNAFLGWDDTASAYENLTDAEAEAIIEPLIDTLANLTSIQSLAIDVDDNNLDQLWGWDDSLATFDNFSLANINTEATPAAGDFLLMYGAEGDLRKVDWGDLPSGSGIANVVEDIDPELGGGLDLNSFDITGTGNINITGAITASTNLTATTGDVTSGDDLISGDDVLLSNAGVINFGAGDCTLTEGTDTLTIAGTCVLVTEAAGLQVGASVPFSDSAGTLTLQNVDALDGTTESTVEAAIDTLDNVSSIGATTESTIEAALDTLANVTSIGGDVTAGGDFISTDDIISGDDVLLSNAGVINFGAGDCTLTEGTDTLTIAGTCTLVSEIIVPDGDNTRDLGSAGATWATAHINSIELANGTTHTLTATGGDLVIEGNTVYRAGGTNVAIADGGTNADDAATAFSNLKQSATEGATGVVELATTGEVETGTDTTRAVTAAGVLAAVTGKKPIWIPAGSLIPRTTNGCTIADFEHPTNDIMERSCNFTQTEQGAGFTVRMPDTWDEGTITAVFVWTHPATVTNFGVVWQVGCVSTSNDDARDAAIGTQQEIADTGGTTSDQYTTSATPAVTCAGSPAAGDTVYFEFEREPGNGSDTLAVDAWLIGVTLYYNDNAFVEP